MAASRFAARSPSGFWARALPSSTCSAARNSGAAAPGRASAARNRATRRGMSPGRFSIANSSSVACTSAGTSGPRPVWPAAACSFAASAGRVASAHSRSSADSTLTPSAASAAMISSSARRVSGGMAAAAAAACVAVSNSSAVVPIFSAKAAAAPAARLRCSRARCSVNSRVAPSSLASAAPSSSCPSSASASSVSNSGWASRKR